MVGVVLMKPWFTVGRPITDAALAWAASRHGGQLREVDSAPFILHPLEVAALLSGRDYDDEVVAAGLLHDVVEATNARIDEVGDRFGGRVARIVAAVTEDARIDNYDERKAALRAQVAASERDAQAVYAADKVVKARELRAEASRAEQSVRDPALLPRLAHYQRSLEMLQVAAPDLPLVRQLAFELWALRHLPPRGVPAPPF
jgi:(p)ppGpp synthase/HD superfamily hydrolase